MSSALDKRRKHAYAKSCTSVCFRSGMVLEPGCCLTNPTRVTNVALESQQGRKTAIL
jgi:hypothetical protein